MLFYNQVTVTFPVLQDRSRLHLRVKQYNYLEALLKHLRLKCSVHSAHSNTTTANHRSDTLKTDVLIDDFQLLTR